MSQQSTFLAAVGQKANRLEGQNELDLANQLRAAAHVIQASDVAHVNAAITALSNDSIVKGTHISPDAVVLEIVKEILFDLAGTPEQDLSAPKFLQQG